MNIALTEDQQRLLAHLHTLGITDLKRLRECFEYELTVEPENKDRINEILHFIGETLNAKLNT